MASSAASSPARSLDSRRLTLVALTAVLLALATLALAAAPPAFAGQASSGELLFYPCTSCHPVRQGQAARKLPNGFKGHEVVLEGHDKLGKGDAACLVCHDDRGRNPGKLKLVDGSLIDIQGDVAQVCFRCHSAKYEEWKAGTHGKRRPKCTAAGCHDPHTPGSVYAAPMLPFMGGGFQVNVLPERRTFVALAQPAPPPGVETPMWFSIVAVVGLVAVGGQMVRLALGRRTR